MKRYPRKGKENDEKTKSKNNILVSTKCQNGPFEPLFWTIFNLNLLIFQSTTQYLSQKWLKTINICKEH